MATPKKPTELRALNVSSVNRPLYAQKEINTVLLERFENPARHHQYLWEYIKAPEFTCLCPITGQPDFATIKIYFAPNNWCVESKSLKLYLGSFRNVGAFHEAVAARIHYDLKTLLEPLWCVVVGRFTPRGGIPFHPRVWSGDVPAELLYKI